MRLTFAMLIAACCVPAPAAPPGTLIRADAIAAPSPSMRAWRVRYATEGGREVTGLVIAPGARAEGPRRVIAWTHGTTGTAERCAPSLQAYAFEQIGGLSAAIARGYTVVAPDYPGLGSAGPHAYLIGAPTAHAVLDAVRAAQSIEGAAAGRDFAVWGLSQGGHAALWTGQTARGYAPDLRLVGVAAAAPPTDLAENLRAGSDPSARAFLTAYTAQSWNAVFGAPLATLGNRSTQGIIGRLAQNNCVNPDAKPRLGAVLGVLALRRDLKSVDLGRIQPWARIARDNSVAATPYGVPLLIAQNDADVIVGATVTKSWARRFCRAGGTLRYVRATGEGHETTAEDTSAATLDWIDARFERERAPDDCSRL